MFLNNKLNFLFFLILLFNFQTIFAEELDRRNTQILINPWTIQDNKRIERREIPNSLKLQILYSPLKNLFIGFSYGIGENKESAYGQYYSSSNRNNALYQFSRTKQGETFTFNLQYYIYKSFFGSLNFGLEKGFTVNRNNYINFSPNSFNLEPYSHKTVFSDRFYSSVGFGYKTDFWEHYLFAIEIQQGFIEAGKIRHIVTFDPNYYSGSFPKQYQDLILSQSLGNVTPKNSMFTQIIISAGTTF
ncbi:hypothetical protein [Leptospira brenneri]|uniref:hypothetical protein n=1 Tax=Leptospira brenneri TaxID=2023182 RepID=UPI000C2AEF0D|nr:hypothetical protein [Leptospira brenneri]PJZ43621.1 hypothetical protein CH361_19520 [Leptospira brenneri]